MNIVIVGHVDHGKSTLISRLLYDTNSLPDGKYEQILASCRQRGMPFEWSFLTDALQVERDQGITLDLSHIWFKTAKRRYVIIDAPGHREFLKNMISGAAASEAALLIIDAKEGVKEQSRRHGYLLHLLGVRQIAVLVNKMDAVNYSQDVFSAIEQEYRDYLKTIGITSSFVIPISAREGDNLVGPSPHMNWHKGPSVQEALDLFTVAPALDDLPLRLPVQDIYKFDDRRIITGRIESGRLSVGDRVVFSPGGQTVRVQSIVSWPEGREPAYATAGESVGITLDEQIFVERGNIASHETQLPHHTNLFRARIFWLGNAPLKEGNRYKLKFSTRDMMAEVKTIEHIVDTDTLALDENRAIERHGVAEVIFRTIGVAAIDAFETNPRTGRVVIMDGYHVSGGGIIDLKGFNDQRVSVTAAKSQNITMVDLEITMEQRALANGHLGGILWFTGLSGSGKSTLAVALQRHLFSRGCQAYVLDGDNIRSGLNKDLGFSAEDRSENIRRAGEVAGLFARAGVIVIASFISPYDKDRKGAQAAAPEFFNTVYIKADLATCEKRDVKGLYKKAREGKIPGFTGISAPYEAPERSDLVIDTAQHSVWECLSQLIDYVEKQFIAPVKTLSILDETSHESG